MNNKQIVNCVVGTLLLAVSFVFFILSMMYWSAFNGINDTAFAMGLVYLILWIPILVVGSILCGFAGRKQK